MATLDIQTPEWVRALRLVRALYAMPVSDPGRASAIAEARSFLQSASSERLRGFARLLKDEATPHEILCALVPLERVDSHTRITDADMGLMDSDRCASGAENIGAGAAACTKPFPCILVADNLRSAFNVGGLFRTADFFAVEALWLCGYTATPEHPQVQRAALGAENTVAWRSVEAMSAAVEELRKRGYTIYALETSTSALPIREAKLSFPCAILLGSERFGLSPEIVAAADGCIAIPGYGMKNSLNVVTAAAIMLENARSQCTIRNS